MQFKEKLMNQTWENDKKPNFGPNFGSFGPTLGTKHFLHGFYLYCIYDNVASYHMNMAKN